MRLVLSRNCVTLLPVLAALQWTPFAPPLAAAAQAEVAATPAATPAGEGGRYFFNLLDHRSRYGQFWFPEPFLAPEMDLDRELRIDWLHTEAKGARGNTVKAELEYAIGMATFEVEGAYEQEDPGEEGFGPIELSVRHPVFQYVSPDDFFDYTLCVAVEVAAPSGSKIARHDWEVVPQMLQLLRLGEHVSVQASIGYSALIGPDQGGTNTLEYRAVFGYALEREDLRLPGILRTEPIFEIDGETGLSREDRGINRLRGVAGVRFNLESIGAAQPRIGFGYVFPIDKGARDEFDWGIVTSLVFEF